MGVVGTTKTRVNPVPQQPYCCCYCSSGDGVVGIILAAAALQRQRHYGHKYN